MVDEKKAPLVVRVPQLGDSFTEGVVARFLKQPGQTVERDEAVLEVDTDKVVVELTAPESGVIASVSPEAAVIRVGDPIYAMYVREEGDGARPAELDGGTARGSVEAARPREVTQAPGLLEWQQVWDVEHVRARASQLKGSGTRAEAVEAGLFATALVRALVAVPVLLARVGQGPPTEVVVEHCEVMAGWAEWSNMSVRPDDSGLAALLRRKGGRRLDARVQVMWLSGSGIVAASPARPTGGMTIVIGPAVDEAVVDAQAKLAVRRRARLTIALAQELAAEHVRAFAAALAEQLKAV